MKTLLKMQKNTENKKLKGLKRQVKNNTCIEMCSV